MKNENMIIYEIENNYKNKEIEIRIKEINKLYDFENENFKIE
ncbi:hypothetical protein [Spiroplasma turonicum]|nr:hypothetical protein [Spiroplasma turonicum]ALX70912.1 hypothetical protein STURO_v1c06530 [Spiroplasma turonicum]